MLTKIDIDTKTFTVTRTRGGYLRHEVDDFLNEISEDYGRLLLKYQSAKAKLQLLNSDTTGSLPVIPAAETTITVVPSAMPVERSVALILQRAQEVADSVLADANGEITKLRTDATIAAAKVVADARAEAGRILADVNLSLALAKKDLADLESAKATTTQLLRNVLTDVSKTITLDTVSAPLAIATPNG